MLTPALCLYGSYPLNLARSGGEEHYSHYSNHFLKQIIASVNAFRSTALVIDSHSIGQAGQKKITAALMRAQRGALHRSACSFHAMVSELTDIP